MVRQIAEKISIPFTVGGGIRTISDIEAILAAGADKVGINSAAVKNPDFLKAAAEKFGHKRIVAAIDAKKETATSPWKVYINGGQTDSGIDAIAWAAEVVKLGAGEILLTSIERDGTKAGFDIELTKVIAGTVSVPVIASGGAGTLEHFYEVLTEGKADAALAASLFHFNELTIGSVKEYLDKKNVPVRI
jgi:cyclase